MLCAKKPRMQYPLHLVSVSKENLAKPHIGVSFDLRKEIVDATSFLDDNARKPVLVHRMYCIANDIYQTPMCVCGEPRKLSSVHREGFLLHCSDTCAQKQKSVVAHSPDLPANDIASQRDMYASGMSLETIGKYFGVSGNKIAQNFVKYSYVELRENLTGDTKTDIQYLVDSGYTNLNIARILNINATTVSRRMGKLGIIRKVAPPDSKILVELYNAGKCMEDIAKLYGVSGPTVKKWLLNADIDIRPHGETIANSSSKAAATKMERHGYPYYPDTKYSTSKAEIEIRDFLNSHGGNFVKRRFYNEATGKWFELDGFDEDKMIAFEFCGLYWHCELVQKDKFYHAHKLKYCEENGISLFTIFEDEWANRKEQVSRFMLAKMGIFDQRIMARKCALAPITGNVRKFFADNHIQGAPIDMYAQFGLLNKGDLIGMVSIGRHHRKTEILCVNRLAFTPGVQCVGGASRLLCRAYEFAGQLVTWSDCRWTDGSVYQKAGFMKDCVLPPDYSYVDIKNGVRLSKQSQMKSKTKCPPGITEHEWANENGLFRIWDCGKIRWVKNCLT